MSLITSIQKDLLREDASISSILRKLYIVSKELKDEELSRWIENELNGYKYSELIPDYRKILPKIKGHFILLGHTSMENMDIPASCINSISKEFFEKISVVTNSIDNLEQLLKSEKDSLTISIPSEISFLLENNPYENAQCMQAWVSISKNRVREIINIVKNKILYFVTELGTDFPEIKDDDDKISKISEKDAATYFATYIVGDGNVTTTGVGNKVKVKTKIIKNDFASLEKYLENEIGLPQEEVSGLKLAIQDDLKNNKNAKKIGDKVNSWLIKLTEKITLGYIANITIDSLPAIHFAIKEFLGLT